MEEAGILSRRGRSEVQIRWARGDYLEHALKFEALLLVFRGPEVDYGPFLRAVSRVHGERDDDISLLQADIKDLLPIFAELRTAKGYSAYNLDRLPALGLFREGRLVTTFNPLLAVSAKAAEKEIEQQFRRFLQIFLDYDPEKVTYNHKK